MSTAKLDDSTQRPLYGERIIEESKKLSIGGLSNKNLVGFKKEFFKLSEEIKNF